MSWRIATSVAADARVGVPGLFDFVVGRDGSASDYMQKSWGRPAPIRVVYSTASDLHGFMNAWLRERSLDDLWTISRARPHRHTP